MKIAVATDNFKEITGHVGRCKGFLILQVENGEIKNRDERENTFTNHGRVGHGHGGSHHSEEHKRGHERLAESLSDCSHLIGKGIGWRLVNDLKVYNIQPIITSEDDAEMASIKFERGELEILDDSECHAH